MIIQFMFLNAIYEEKNQIKNTCVGSYKRGLLVTMAHPRVLRL